MCLMILSRQIHIPSFFKIFKSSQNRNASQLLNLIIRFCLKLTNKNILKYMIMIMGMNNKKPVILVLLLLLIVSNGERSSSVVEGRALSLVSHQEYSKIFSTLGVVCKCCDGIDGACSNTWTNSCTNLQCLPWKSHQFIIFFH